MATLEIIYSKIGEKYTIINNNRNFLKKRGNNKLNSVSSDLDLAKRACLAAHNNYRFRHGLSNEYKYNLGSEDLMSSAKVFRLFQNN